MLNKTLCFIGLFILFSTLSAVPVELKNSTMQLSVLPEKGGKIIALQSNGFSFALPQKKIQETTPGLAKFRIFGDNCGYMEQKWKVVSQSARSLTLQISGLPPKQNLEITKTFTLPETGNYVRIELKLKNKKPIEGGFKVVPWIHSAFIPDTASSWIFHLAHQKGVEQLKLNPKLTVSNALKHAGNWITCFNPIKKQGLLMVSESLPEAVYSFISKDTCSLEMLYPATDPTQEKNIVYYLAPIVSLDTETLTKTGIPVKLSPVFSNRHTAGERIDVLSYFKSAGEKNIPVNFKFWKTVAYASPDITLPLTFGIRQIQPGKTEFEVDLPDFIYMTAYSGNYWSHVKEDMKLLRTRTIIRNGRKYTRHRFEVTCKTIPIWFHSHCRILVKAMKNEGEALVYYRGYHNEKQTMEASIPCKVLRIPEARTPQKFKVLMGIDYGLLHAWQDYSEAMKHLGINGMCADWSVPNKVITADQVKAMNTRLKKQGFMTSVMGIFYVPTEHGYQVSPELSALDIDGKPTRAFDFTLRGSWMNAVAQNAAKHMNLGYDLIISDYEPYFGGERYSFTAHTLKMFKQYFMAKYPALKYIEPGEIIRNSERYPQQHKIWVQFKCDQFADYLKTVVEKSRKLCPDATRVGLCTIPGASEESIRIDNLCDNQQFNAILDYNMPMLYNNLYRNMQNYHNEVDLFQNMATGKRAVIFPTLTLGFWGEDNPFPPEHSFFLLLETALTQCRGAYIFPGFAGSDNLGVMYLSRAMNLIADIEDFIEGAIRQDRQVTILECHNSGLNLPASVEPLVLIKGNKMLVWLAEYSSGQVQMKVDFNLPADCRITALSGSKVNSILKKEDTYAITLHPGDGKGQLLLLETIDGSNFPIRKTVTQEEDTAHDQDLIFHDAFDNSTFGKNGSATHFYQFDSAGKKGACLYMRDYESFWTLPRQFNLPSGELTIEFYFKASRMFGPGNNVLWDMIRGNPGKDQLFWLFFDPVSGKMCFALGKQKNGKVVDWPIRLLSKTERWPANIWMPIKLNLGKAGIQLTVNGKTEINTPNSIHFDSLSHVQIGRPFVSTGRFDELKIYDVKR